MSVTNSPLLQEPLAETPSGKAAPSGLPPFRPLAVTAFAANVPLLSWLLLTGRLASAVSLLAGFLIGIALYGSLHLFVGRALEPLFAGIRGQGEAKYRWDQDAFRGAAAAEVPGHRRLDVSADSGRPSQHLVVCRRLCVHAGINHSRHSFASCSAAALTANSEKNLTGSRGIWTFKNGRFI